MKPEAEPLSQNSPPIALHSTLSSRILTVAISACILSAALPLSAKAEPAISVKIDRATIMRIARPASTVILGNPSIADATIQDRQTLIITGHSFGTTNLIVLDKDGQAVADELITVSGSDNGLVTVYTGTTRQSFSCSPDCQPVMSLGDTASVFADVKGKLDGRNSLITAATPGN